MGQRQIILGLTMAENFRMVMNQEGIRVQDITNETGLNHATIHRILQRVPKNNNKSLLLMGKYLGFTETQAKEMARRDRSVKGQSKMGRFYQLIHELIELYEAKLEK